MLIFPFKVSTIILGFNNLLINSMKDYISTINLVVS